MKAFIKLLYQNYFAMEDEIIIRQEAKQFYDWEIDRVGNSAVKQMHALKERLYDFYSPEYKAVFLDEIQQCIVNFLIDHRNTAHGGRPKQDCQHEILAEKLLFYIRQEIGTLPAVAHQKNVDNSVQPRNKVFVSYCHVDKEYLEDIKRHFKPFLSQIEVWDDTKIQPGQKWREEIRNAINETKVAILLVSTDFLGSDFISTNELPPLLAAAEEHGAVILTVVVKPCLFEEFPALNQFQAMNPPSRPVIKMEYSEREDLFVNLVRQTKRVLSVNNKQLS